MSAPGALTAPGVPAAREGPERATRALALAVGAVSLALAWALAEGLAPSRPDAARAAYIEPATTDCGEGEAAAAPDFLGHWLRP